MRALKLKLKLKIIVHDTTKLAITLSILANVAAVVNTNGKKDPAIFSHGVSMVADHFGDESRFVRSYFSGDVDLFHKDGDVGLFLGDELVGILHGPKEPAAVAAPFQRVDLEVVVVPPFPFWRKVNEIFGGHSFLKQTAKGFRRVW